MNAFFGSKERFRQSAIGILVASIPILLLGAFVRASLSGDGCGVNWPLCGETLLPKGDTLKSIIEFSHRASTSIYLLAIAVLHVWSRFIFPKGSAARRGSGAALIFTIISGLIGAVLVKFNLVTIDKSTFRAVVMALHLVNNYFLLASLLLASLPSAVADNVRLKGQGMMGGFMVSSALGMFLLAMTGALSAMGKTAWHNELAAARSLAERVNMHLGTEAPALLKGGAIHPLIATSVMILVVIACRYAVKVNKSEEVSNWSQAVLWGFALQMAIGVLSIVMSAPIWLQLIHLGAAIGTWIALMVLGAYSLQKPADVPQEVEEVKMAGSAAAAPAGYMAIVKEYIALTKPRVISLLLFTTVLAMVIANRGQWPSIWLMIAVTIGGYMAAGAANTFNMVVERDLDLAMERTASRPTVTQSITNAQALIFAVLMTVGSFVLLSAAANVLSAMMALSGLAFYVLIYTLLLKRRTWQNIVIGGAAGAFPPLVGYAAVKNELSVFAWVLFAIIFFWTPVHFWALAILIKDDYAKAGVPMLPVVKGDRATVIHIVFYAILTGLISIVPLFQREVGLVYFIFGTLLNVGLIVQSVLLMRHTDKPRAKALFKYSMVYLALMFVVIAVDRAVIPL